MRECESQVTTSCNPLESREMIRPGGKLVEKERETVRDSNPTIRRRNFILCREHYREQLNFI